MADKSSKVKETTESTATTAKKRITITKSGGRPKTSTRKYSSAHDAKDGEIVKPKFNRHDVSEARSVHTQPGDNRKYLMHALSMWDWPQPDMTDYNEVYERIMNYFGLCEQNDMKPSFEGLAVAFGVSRRQMYNWVHDTGSKYIPDNVRNMLKKATAILNSMMADYMQNGKINPVSGIFLMKNNLDYSDQSQLIVTPQSPLGTDPNERDLQAKLMDGTIVELPDEYADVSDDPLAD